VRQLLSAAMFGLVLLVVPDGLAVAGSVLSDTGLIVSIVCGGAIGGYSYVLWYRSIRKIGVARAMALNISYALWGAVFAWSLRHAPLTLLAIAGCAAVTSGAVLTILSNRVESTLRDLDSSTSVATRGSASTDDGSP
jgi:drug/metabolite transporter (DMT)-like permease